MEEEIVAQNYYIQSARDKKPNFNKRKPQKRGVVGPYRCFLCELVEETINHLLDSCTFASTIWDQGVLIFRRFDWVRQNSDRTLTEWTNNPFQNPILNRLLEVFPHFVLWEIWWE